MRGLFQHKTSVSLVFQAVQTVKKLTNIF